MTKNDAIHLLGGTKALAATAVGISYQAVRQWPDNLPLRIQDRVMAAVARLDVTKKSEKDKNLVTK